MTAGRNAPPRNAKGESTMLTKNDKEIIKRTKKRQQKRCLPRALWFAIFAVSGLLCGMAISESNADGSLAFRILAFVAIIVMVLSAYRTFKEND